MKFWFSGEVDALINDAYTVARNRLESRLNTIGESRDYGPALAEIAIIPIILRPEFLTGRRERKLWQRKDRSADYRLIIDFEAFRRGDDAHREQLLLENVLAAIADLKRKIGPTFAADQLTANILADFKSTKATG